MDGEEKRSEAGIYLHRRARATPHVVVVVVVGIKAKTRSVAALLSDTHVTIERGGGRMEGKECVLLAVFFDWWAKEKPRTTKKASKPRSGVVRRWRWQRSWWRLGSVCVCLRLGEGNTQSEAERS